MPYFPVDDSFHSHPKALVSSLAAVGLWAVSGSWSNRHHTDGFVPDYAVPSLSRGATELVDELVAAGLWRRVKGGYRFHEWEADGTGTRRNFTSQEVNERRRIKAEAGRKGGVASGKTRSKREADASADAKQEGKQNGTKSNPHTHTHTHRREEDSLRSSSSARKRPATKLPEDWQPTEKHRAFASEHQLNLEREVFRFRHHADANDRRQANWNSAFTTWLDKARDYQPRRGGEDWRRYAEQ